MGLVVFGRRRPGERERLSSSQALIACAVFAAAAETSVEFSLLVACPAPTACCLPLPRPAPAERTAHSSRKQITAAQRAHDTAHRTHTRERVSVGCVVHSIVQGRVGVTIFMVFVFFSGLPPAPNPPTVEID